MEAFCARLRLPSRYRELAVVVSGEHINVHRAPERRAGTLLELLERLHAFRNLEFFNQVLEACLCDARGRAGLEQCEYAPVAYLKRACEVAAALQARDVMSDAVQGSRIGVVLRENRVRRLAAWIGGRSESETVDPSTSSPQG